MILQENVINCSICGGNVNLMRYDFVKETPKERDSLMSSQYFECARCGAIGSSYKSMMKILDYKKEGTNE